MNAQERVAPGFLQRAYGDRRFTEANDAAVAGELEPLARLHGCELTGEIVGKARLVVGLKRRSSPRRSLDTLSPSSKAPAEPGLVKQDEPQPSLPGIQSDQLAAAMWALHGELKALRLELAAHRRVA